MRVARRIDEGAILHIPATSAAHTHAGERTSHGSGVTPGMIFRELDLPFLNRSVAERPTVQILESPSALELRRDRPLHLRSRARDEQEQSREDHATTHVVPTETERADR